jgi:hypothetical protein
MALCDPLHHPTHRIKFATPKCDYRLHRPTAPQLMNWLIIYILMTVFLTLGYILLAIVASGSPTVITRTYIFRTLSLCAIVSAMFLIALEEAIDIANGDHF